jgi:DNA-directed RNA polymerase subunit RPC12/RpoP
MAMVCSQCRTTYEQRLQCPQCGTRLLFQDRRAHDRPTGAPTRWQQSPWGRILIGLVLAQGLFYGLRHLLIAVLMATQGSEVVGQMWTAASGILLLQGVRIISLLVGAVFGGSGQRQGLFVGALIGAWNGVLSVLYLPGPAQSLTTVAILGQPLLQAAVGGVGGWLGSAFWRAVPTEAPEATPVRKRNLLRQHMNLFAGPVAWFRVGAGVLLAVVGTLTATICFEKILDISHGALATTDDLQDRLITMEMKALAILLGGALGGSTTANGLKQGLCVGLATTVILLGIEMNYVERWIQMGALTAVCSLCLSAVGGWFGSQLFPPILKVRRARGFSRASL